MSSARRVISIVSGAFVAAGIVALAWVAYVAIDASLYQANEQRTLEQARPVEPVAPVEQATPPVAEIARPADGDLVGKIAIARLGLSVMVVQGESDPTLRRGVGHLTETALPGEAGNVVLAAHRDTFFRPLRHVRIGDAITVTTRDGDFDYRVESTRIVAPTELSVLDATDEHELTLITCYPFFYVGSAPKRFIVRAREIGSTTLNASARQPLPITAGQK